MSKYCPLCNDESHELVTDTVKGDEKINVWRCRNCELDFLDIWDDVNYVKSLYEGENYVFSANVLESNDIPLKYNEYKERFKRIRPYLDKKKTLLEIGCGDGTFLRMVRDFVLCAEGTEVSPPQVTRLRKEGFTCYDVFITEMEPPRQYDVVCMFALLEHVPNIKEYFESLKRFLAPDAQIFIEVPNLNCPLMSCYDIEEFRKFYYRPVHLYYFTPNALGRILAQCGFEYEITTSQQASLTNHFHWAYKRHGQPSANHMTSALPPVRLMKDSFFSKDIIIGILDTIDDCYRQMLVEHNMGDLLAARAWLNVVEGDENKALE